jgi:hypothetical protein
MKKIFILTLLSTIILSCKGPTPEPGDEPLPAIDGKLLIKFADARLETKADLTLSNEDVLSISYNIKKALDGSKPVKMAAYLTDDIVKRGVLLLDNIRLKDLDEQTRSLEISLPTAGTTINRVFYIEITDSKDKITRKGVNISPSGAEQISTWTNVNVGVLGSTIGSRFSSATGDIYTTCDLDSNLNFVDVTYATIGSPSIRPTFLSNPRRAALGLGVTASDKICTNISTAGGIATYYAPINVPIEFATVNDLFLKNLAIPSTTQDIVIEAGKIYMFQNSRTTRDGKAISRKGVIRVNSIGNSTSTTGSTIASGLVNFDVKVQR